MVSRWKSAGALRTLLFLSLSVCAVTLSAQQTGAIVGTVMASDGSALPGVTIEARSNVLPTPRTTVSGSKGEYRLLALPPGTYTVKFDLSGMQSVTRNAEVLLSQETRANVTLGLQQTEAVSVTATTTLVDKESATIENGLSTKELQALPKAQDYRDLQKYIPAV